MAAPLNPLNPSRDEPAAALPRTCAIVVTYHPDLQVIENIAALRPQVEDLVVVDNGSEPGALAMLEEAAARLGFQLIANGDNLGVATALNVGVRRATGLGHSWIFLFDQDSRVSEGFTAAMLRCFAASRWGDGLGLLVPRYKDMRDGHTLAEHRLASGTLEIAITSGSLLPVETLRRRGLFRDDIFMDDLFIDGVDHEFCLRLRRAGLLIDTCTDAVLLHSPGTPRRHELFGKVRFSTTNYSPIRRYYQARNNVWIARHYLGAFPRFSLKLLLTSARDAVKIVLAEPDKRRKLSFFFSGLYDGLRGNLGKRR